MSASDRTSGTASPGAADEEVIIPVVAEELDVTVHERSTGRVRVTTRTETVQQDVEETLSSLTAEIRRVPVERELAPGEALPEARVEDGVTIVPVLEERLVIEKRLVLVEEVHIERRRESETVTTPVTLRRQRVDVERLPGDDDPHDP